MTHDDHTPASEPVTDSPREPDGAGAAFVAAIEAGLQMLRSMRRSFRVAADEAAIEPSPIDELEQAETSLRMRYAHAVLEWNELEARARAHRVAFSPAAEAHHRAAILDYFDNPEAPTLLAHRHMTWVHPIDEDGYGDHSPIHPAARAIYRLKAQRYPTVYPPERIAWSAGQWHRHGNEQSWFAKSAPEVRAPIEAWARRIAAEREDGTCKTSWRAPGYNGPRRRPGLEVV